MKAREPKTAQLLHDIQQNLQLVDHWEAFVRASCFQLWLLLSCFSGDSIFWFPQALREKNVMCQRLLNQANMFENILLPSHWSCSSLHEYAQPSQSVPPCITHRYKQDPDHAVSTCQYFCPVKLAGVHDTELRLAVLLPQLGSGCVWPDGPWYSLKPLRAKLAWTNPNLLDILTLDQCSVLCGHAAWPKLIHLIKGWSRNCYILEKGRSYVMLA